MIRLLGIAILFGFSLNARAQVPERKATALIHKITATWCTPCGTWGWTLAEDIRQATTEKALYLGLFASGSTANQNAAFYNETAATLANAFTFSGYPSFGVNGLPYSEPSATGGIDAALVKANVLIAVDSFNAQDPIASAAGYYSMDGDQIMVQAKVRFWQATEGAFYLAAYIVEDKAMNLQSGRSLTGDEVEHHDVLRASMSPEGAWGVLIDSGQISESDEATVNFSYVVTDSSWNSANLKVYLVLWSKEQEQYRFVNAAVATADPLGITEANFGDTRLHLFPNPAGRLVRVSVDPNMQADMHIRIRDLSGRTLFSQYFRQPLSGAVEVDIGHLREGVYILERQQGQKHSTARFIILR